MNNWRYKLTALMLGALGVPAYAATATTTTLTVGPSSSVVAGTVITLTAAVADPAAVTKGTVNFCDASATVCISGQGLVGTAQLTSSGAATLKVHLGVGTHSIKAVFLATSGLASSSSVVTSVTITAAQISASATTLSPPTGSAGNYTLSGYVSAYGTGSISGEIVSLLDTSNANSQVATVVLGTPTIGFISSVTTGTTYEPNYVTVGDFNGDGYPDVASTGYILNGCVSHCNFVQVGMGKGDGTFAAVTEYDTNIEPGRIVSGDINGDGKLDLVMASYGNQYTAYGPAVMLGNGDGTFAAYSAIAVSSSCNSRAVALADMNRDGNLDIVVGCTAGTSAYVLLGNGDGTFQTALAISVGTVSDSIAVADFNGDGIPDVAYATDGNSGIIVTLGNGDGTFQTPVSYYAGTYPIDVTLGDFNGDGRLDLAVANYGSKSVSVLLGNGDGTFQTAVNTTVPLAPNFIAAGDFNNDGINDVSVVYNGEAAVLIGKGDGTFNAATMVGSTNQQATFGDMNGDGLIDVVSAYNDGFWTALGNQKSTFSVSGVAIVGSSGTHAVDASYPGDTIREPSVSSTWALTESKLVPTIALSTSPSAGTYGSTVTLTATMTGADSLQPTGTVSFMDGSTSYGSVTISGTTAVFATSLPIGNNSLTAVYGGDGNFATATSAAVPYTVSQASVAVLVASTEDPSNYGDSVTITVSVTGTSAVPTGSVVITDGGTTVGTATLNGSGVGTVTTSSLSAGTHNLIATYSGDSNYY